MVKETLPAVAVEVVVEVAGKVPVQPGMVRVLLAVHAIKLLAAKVMV